jgi:hypothetical protein
VLLVSTGAHAQIAPYHPPVYELRTDARFARDDAFEAGGSVLVPAGMYVRGALTVVGGIVRRPDWTGETRVETTARFLLDPFREARYGLSFGSGIGVTNSSGSWRPYLAVLADVELRRKPGWTPALQLGLGSGWRVGIAMRNSRGTWR